MPDTTPTASATLLQAVDVAANADPRTAPNGVRFAIFGETRFADRDILRVVGAVPAAVAPALADRAYYFVPLALAEPRSGSPRPADPELDPRDDSGRTLVAPEVTPELLDEAICHRNVALPVTPRTPAHEGVFISSRILRDTFSLAFEFFINVAHPFAAHAGIPDAFSELAWSQVTASVRGETSQDAWEARAAATGVPAGEPFPAVLASTQRNQARPGQGQTDPARAPDEKARFDYLESAFSDALAIYLLSLAVDFDYAELREREYPLLAPNALADRLRLMAKLFPPNPGYDFSIRYRRR